MERATALTPATRVLDLGAPDAEVARDLARRGVTRYLGLVPPAALEDARSDAGPLAGRFHALESPDVVVRCAADVLVVRASQTRVLWAARDLGHLRVVAVERSAGVPDVERRLAALAARLTGRLEPGGRVRLGGRTFELLVVRHRSTPEPRVYFSPVWGPTGLAERLATSGVHYVVLRWFDALPVMAPGEDLDVLVADEDLATVRTLLTEEPGTITMDLYSVSGLPYSDYGDAAYYPPGLARRILDGAQMHASGFRVPGALDHLHSLAYHAVYHKGPRSGIVSERHPAETDPEHDYGAALTALAVEHGIEPPTTLEEWDGYLASVGWQPPPDALRKLAPSNPWITAGNVPREARTPSGDELAVFLVREQTLAVVDIAEVTAVLEHFGFDVLASQVLAGPARDRCAAVVRGGNWGQGPFPRSGGRPALVLAALHYAPSTPWDDLRMRYPHLTNADVLGVKLRLRDIVAARVPSERTFNPVHSADNEDEAWEYLTAATPELVHEVRDAIADRRSHLELDVPVLRRLSHGRRARVDVVDGPDGPVVRKTYAPRFVRHLERELRVMAELSGAVAAVPRVLDHGPNWFTCTYYTNALGDLTPGRLVPLGVLRQMVAVLREIHDHGIDLVDAKPQNFLLDPVEGLKVVDFEFAREHTSESRRRFADSLNFVGTPPQDDDGDVPVGDQAYERLWLPYTGLPRDVLAEGTVVAQHLHRLFFRLRQATVAPGAPVRRPLGRARRAARHLRWLAGRRFAHWTEQRAGTAPGAR